MYGSEPTAAPDLLAGLSGKSSPIRLVLDDLAVGIGGPHKSGDGRYQCTVTLQAGSQNLLGVRMRHRG
jgi:hypothetical protein